MIKNDCYNDTLTIDDLLALGALGGYISNGYYHSLPGLSGSSLSLLDESCLHYENKVFFAIGDQSHFSLGSWVHELVLEPHLSSYTVMPNFDGRTTAGKLAKNEWMAENQLKKVIMSEDDCNKAFRMARSVNAICSVIIDESICERSLFVEYSPGIILKARIDAQHGHDDYDLKTITPKNGMDEWELKRHAEKYGYYMSAAFRNLVRESLGMTVKNSYLIFVSTSPGHMVKVRKIPDEEIFKARMKVIALLESWKDYKNYGINQPTKELLSTTKEDY